MPALDFPNSPLVGDKFTSGARTYTWTGSTWSLDATSLLPLSVGTQELQSQSVTNAKLAANAVTTSIINNNAVTTLKINNGAVTTAKLATNAITSATLASTPVNNYVLTADSTTGTGSKWAAVPASGGLATSTEGAIMIMDVGA
jgi:hypothetical protein